MTKLDNFLVEMYNAGLWYLPYCVNKLGMSEEEAKSAFIQLSEDYIAENEDEDFIIEVLDFKLGNELEAKQKN